MDRERRRFAEAHPRSAALFERSRVSLLGGVPMNWMSKWPGSFPPFVERASGGHFTCVDGHDYVDFCLGDTGAMTGHAPEASVQAIRAQLERGITTMLPTEDAPAVGEELA
ncbi:MAG TPA: aspartate aminotransferase family protein, partial [Candidatus Limnocylindria bacterium]|nr:aspartate aminotransferase family protein [Candidatus Limnocylindria bacterium]